MKGRAVRWLVPAAIALTLMARGHLGAQNNDKEPGTPQEAVISSPAEVMSVAVHPTTVRLKGEDDSCQLIATGTLRAAKNGGSLQDLSGDVKYAVTDAKVARVTTSGRVIPLADG